METLILYLVIPGRINFHQLGRYGKSCEQRFRQNFLKDSDWLEFNLSLSDRILTGDRKAIAIDPSCISKSGINTPWISYFWSGTAGMAKRGLEILGVGIGDIDNKDCISLQAVQTPDRHTLESRDANLSTGTFWFLNRYRRNAIGQAVMWLLTHMSPKTTLPRSRKIWNLIWSAVSGMPRALPDLHNLWQEV